MNRLLRSAALTVLVSLALATIGGTGAIAQRAPNGWAYDMVRADEAQALGFTGAGVRVAILDNGIDPRALGITGKVVGGFDAINSANGLQEHGTATAGIVAAETYAEAGIGGIAPGVEILNVKVCTQSNCRTEAMIPGLKWAIDNGADVISMSLGGAGADPAVSALIRDAIAAGIVVVAAAGNSACQANYDNGTEVKPRNCTQTSISRNFPSALPYDGLISVAAVDNNKKRASYSSYNPQVDVAAPGTGVATTFPWGPNSQFGGTSAATPVVAGIVALMREAAPTLSPAQIQAVLQLSATEATTSIPDVWDSCTWDQAASRWNCTNLSPAKWPARYYTGAGVVDAVAAVQLAVSLESKLLGSNLSAPAVEASATSLQIDWSASGLGSGPYLVKLDGKVISEETATGVTLDSLIQNATYALTVQDSEGLETPPILATPKSVNLPATRNLTNASPGSYGIHLSISDTQGSDLGVLMFTDGRRVTCSGLTCDYSMPAGTATATYALGDVDGNLGTPSAAVTFTSTLQFDAPSNVRITQITATTAHMSWDPVPGATHYHYYSPGTGQWITTAENSGNLTGLLPGLTNSTRVAVSNANGNILGVWSPWHWFYGLPDPLPALSNLTTKRLNPNELSIGFTVSPEAERILFVRSDGKLQYMPASSPEIYERFSQSEEGKTFSYRFVAIDDLQYGTQYGELSEPFTITVPYSQRNDQIQIHGSLENLAADQERTFTATTTSNRDVNWQTLGACHRVQTNGNSITVKTDFADADCTIQATTDENSDWKASFAEVSFWVVRQQESLRLSGAVSKLPYGQVITITATTSSNRQVFWNSNCPQVQSIGANKVQLKANTGFGVCKVSASLPDDNMWTGASAELNQTLTKANDKLTLATALTITKKKTITVTYKALSGRQVTLASTSKCTVRRISTNRFTIATKYTSGTCTVTASLPESATTFGTKATVKVTLR